MAYRHKFFRRWPVRNWDAIEAFVEVVQQGSFSAAAAASGPKTSSAVRSTATTGRSMPHRRAPGRPRAAGKISLSLCRSAM